MVQITDTLKAPLGATLNATLRIIADASTGSLLKFSSEDITITNGVCDFTLEEGVYTLWIKYSDTFEEVGTLTVTDVTPSPTTLSEILS